MTFEMVPDDVTSHAGNVDGLAGELTKAGQKGGGVDLGVETYGIIGQAFSLHARASIASVGCSISELATALPEIADALRDCADTTRETDEHHAGLFDKFLGGAR
ncbi:ESX-1 secretion-associated protein [Actinophytocola gossypii]|uniref:ESX-1 secretion-associated protein n=1 Tax=Actinophytocola gossypii TaxID=2812003 RepID=A0ABT2J1K4_9PSEU|nr:ESX-1 secretion-associated protein [Actinophytocola gossypii]MCT2581546.1 hypothetical protein [Actinophytocola gossypii]